MSISELGVCSTQYCSPQGNPINPRPKTNWIQEVLPGSKATLSIFKQLNTVLDVELSVRNISLPTWTAYKVGDRVTTGMLKNIIDAINQCRTYDEEDDATVVSFQVGKQLSTRMLSELRELANNLQAVCVCNCNYCACNCDFCGCDCNHSTTCTVFKSTANSEKS